LKVVAKHANRYNHPCGSVQVLKRKISLIKEHCTSIGRNHKDIEYSILASCLVRETEEELGGNKAKEEATSWNSTDKSSRIYFLSWDS